MEMISFLLSLDPFAPSTPVVGGRSEASSSAGARTASDGGKTLDTFEYGSLPYDSSSPCAG